MPGVMSSSPSNPAKHAPIGIFDSGLGGLTVARTIMDQLPGEPIHYIGDTKYGPYGPLPIAEVRRHAERVADSLVEAGCKILVIACNTASAAFLHDARERYDIPVVEVIKPAVRRAMATTRNGKVGVIGTVGTMTSGAYQDMFSINPSIEIHAQACPDLVTFVERGETTGDAVFEAASNYLAPLRDAGVDTLVLGCTHYPLLSSVLQLAIGDNVTLVSSAEEATKDVYKICAERDLFAEEERPERRFETTGEVSTFTELASRFLGPGVGDLDVAGGVSFSGPAR